MKILIGNILLLFAVLSNLVGLSFGVRYAQPISNVDPDPQPTLVQDIPEARFQVEGITLSAGSKENPGRTFNTDFIRTIPDTEYHKFFQFNIIGTNLKFVFERDAYRRIVNVVKLNGNRRPERRRTYLATHVATINDIQFLVHKTSSGYIVGASPPPNQVATPRVENHTLKIEPEEPGPSHKRPRVVPTHTIDFLSGKMK